MVLCADGFLTFPSVDLFSMIMSSVAIESLVLSLAILPTVARVITGDLRVTADFQQLLSYSKPADVTLMIQWPQYL